MLQDDDSDIAIPTEMDADGVAQEDDVQLNEDEEESWEMSLRETIHLKGSFVPLEGDTSVLTLPRRLAGMHVLVFRNGEWDLAKIENAITAADQSVSYRYKVVNEWVYGNHSFTTNTHGRYNPSSSKWVLLK